MLADGILYWTPLILDGILTGNFNGKVVTGIHGMMPRETLSCLSFCALIRDVSVVPQAPAYSALCLCTRQGMADAPRTSPSHTLEYPVLSNDWMLGAGTLREAAWYSAKLSLISAILFTLATIAIVAGAYSSSYFQERNIHMACFLTISGIAFM